MVRDPTMQRIVDCLFAALLLTFAVLGCVGFVSVAFGGDIYGPDAPQHPCWVDASCSSVDLAKQIPGWETVHKLGLRGDGVVLVWIKKGKCGYLNGNDGLHFESGLFRPFINGGETPDDGIDNDGNGCVDDYYGCYTTTTATYTPPDPNYVCQTVPRKVRSALK